MPGLGARLRRGAACMTFWPDVLMLEISVLYLVIFLLLRLTLPHSAGEIHALERRMPCPERGAHPAGGGDPCEPHAAPLNNWTLLAFTPVLID